MGSDDLLTGPQVAARLGITPGTWRGYVARGQAPPPDDPDTDRPASRRQPRWRTETIEAYAGRTKRPGARTDLR